MQNSQSYKGTRQICRGRNRTVCQRYLDRERKGADKLKRWDGTKKKIAQIVWKRFEKCILQLSLRRGRKCTDPSFPIKSTVPPLPGISTLLIKECLGGGEWRFDKQQSILVLTYIAKGGRKKAGQFFTIHAFMPRLYSSVRRLLCAGVPMANM